MDLEVDLELIDREMEAVIKQKEADLVSLPVTLPLEADCIWVKELMLRDFKARMEEHRGGAL